MPYWNREKITTETHVIAILNTVTTETDAMLK